MIYREEDIQTNILRNKTVSVIGYGSQGRAQALNMRDSGLNVIIGLRKGKSWSKAEKEGFQVKKVNEATEEGDVILVLIPDMVQSKVFKGEIGPNLSEGKALCFAHGFAIHYNLITPPENVDVFMVAPKGPGAVVRRNYLEGFGVPSLIAVHQNYTGKAKEKALEIGKAIGSARVGLIETTFKEETETDLIGEQAVLVGGLIELIKKGFEVLTELGYQPEVAYFEVLNEAKLIMDLIYSRGFTGMLNSVSVTARYGGLKVGPQVLDEHVKESMKKAAEKVRNGSFAKEWVKEYESGGKTLEKLLQKISSHEIEEVGSKIRKLAKIK